MGTRGAVVLVAGGTEQGMYNHWDSYPSGLGESTLDWLKEVLGGHREDEVKQQIVNLIPIDEQAEPSVEQKQKLDANAKAAGLGGIEAFSNSGVSTGKDWYSYLRQCQGNLDLVLASGYISQGGKDFPLESLWCEWAYVIDFDQQVFEVYKGFQESAPTEGRYVGREPEPSGNPIGDKYYPCNRIAAFKFDALPDDLSALEKSDDDEDAA